MTSLVTTYLLTSALVLLGSTLLYCVAFLRSTFLQWNRVLLWCILLASLGLPLIHLPADWTIWPPSQSGESNITTPNHNNLEVTAPVLGVEESISNTTTTPKPELQSTPKTDSSYHYTQLLFYLYCAGCLFFSLRFFLQILSLILLFRKARFVQRGGYRLVVCSEALSPFAFGRNIFISEDHLQHTDIQLILTHELAHVRQWHTLDIVVAELTLVWQWFNPGAWLFRRIVETNLEYLADRQVLQQTTNKKRYQLSLLNWVNTHAGNTLSTSYNFSLLKERIMMMNRKPSSQKHLLRYAIMGLILPLFSTLNRPMLIEANSSSVVRTTALDQVPLPPNQQVTAVPAPQTKIKTQDTKLPLGEKNQQLSDTIPSKQPESKSFMLVFSPSINDKEQADLVKSVLTMGKKLEFIRTAEGKIIGGKLSTSSDGSGNCSVWHNKDDYELPIVIYGQPGGCSTGSFDESFLDKLINNEIITPQLISVGLPKDKAQLEAFRPKIIAQFQKDNKERLEKLASTNWIESTSMGSTSYRIPVQEKAWESIKRKINAYAAQNKDYIISIDGQQFQSVLPEIDLAKVTKMILYEGRRTEYIPGTLQVKHSESANLRLDIALE